MIERADSLPHDAWLGLAWIAHGALAALLDNQVSHAVHLALGFQESERVVFFRKLLNDGGTASQVNA